MRKKRPKNVWTLCNTMDTQASSTPVTVSDPNILRFMKGYDALKLKLTKVTEDNARLKQQLAELKASQSRIRRIPKKVCKEGDITPEPAPVA